MHIIIQHHSIIKVFSLKNFPDYQDLNHLIDVGYQ